MITAQTRQRRQRNQKAASPSSTISWTVTVPVLGVKLAETVSPRSLRTAAKVGSAAGPVLVLTAVEVIATGVVYGTRWWTRAECSVPLPHGPESYSVALTGAVLGRKGGRHAQLYLVGS